MKQETGKTKKKWLLPVIIAAAVLVIVGVVLAIFLGPWGQQSAGPVSSKLYWNLDREQSIDPETLISARKPGADGLYTMRFAVDGEVVEYKCADKRLVTNMDFLNVMGLVFDADGLIVQAIRPEEVATEIAKEFFVKSFDGTNLVLNSSIAMNGMHKALTVTDQTGIYNVAHNVDGLGKTCSLEPMDTVYVFGSDDETVTHIFMMKRPERSDVYYRIYRKYDTTTKMTSREPDENGVYTIEFACNGKQVELKCKDQALVSNIDSGRSYAAHMGLVFDEEGYIIKKIPASEAIKGKLLYDMYNVTAIDGDTISLSSLYYANTDAGAQATMTLPKECEIYLIEDGCDADFIGQATDHLKVGDRCFVYSDLEDVPQLIFVENRKADSVMYYNTSRKYDSTNKVTTRVPDENGYYVYDFLAQGKQMTLKTKDKNVATQVDAVSNGCMGLKVSGDIIKDVYDANCLCGQGSLSHRFVTDIMSGIIRLVSSDNMNSGASYVLAPDAEIYDITGNCKVPLGSKTDVRVFDKAVYSFINEYNQIQYMYINQRYEEDAQFVFCTDRQFNTETQETSRIPDADGYYVYNFTSEGKQFSAKTKDKEIADWIDKYSTNSPISIKVSGGIIKNAYKPETAVKYGRVTMGGSTFLEMYPNNTFEYLNSRGEQGTSPYSVSKDCKVYNCTTVYDKFRGEKTTLRKGDVLYIIISYETKQIEKMLVTNGRYFEGPLYWHVDRQYNFTTKQTTREPDADGWYKIELAVDGGIKTFKTKDKQIATNVDQRASYFSLLLDGDIIKGVVEYTRVANIDKPMYAGYTVTAVGKDTVTVTDLRGGKETYGDVQKLKLTKNSKIMDLSSYADKYGAYVKLVPGDEVTPVLDDNGNVAYIFVSAKYRREAGFIAHCEHCDKEVMWVAFTGKVNQADTHYYLPADLTTVQIKVGYDDAAKEKNPDWKPYEMVMDLNGNKLISSTYRAFFVYTGSLSIMDSVGTGAIVAGNKGGNGGAIRATDGVTVNIYGGTIMPNEEKTPHARGALFYGSNYTLNIYGGTLIGGIVECSETQDIAGGGAIYTSNGKINIYGGTIKDGAGLKNQYGNGRGGNIWAYKSELNIYGGTIENGSATRSGGNINVDSGKFNLYGGTITGGVSVGGSGDVYLYDTVAEISGGTVTGGVAISGDKVTVSGSPVLSGKLAIPAGNKIILGDLKEGASIRVSAEGVFTTENENAADYADYFKPSRVFDTVTEVGGALVYTKYEVDGNAIDNSNLAFDEGTTKALCPACGEKVTWIALDQATYAEKAYGAMDDGVHLYLAEDITYTGTEAFIGGASTGMTGCVHLNGKNLHAASAKVFSGGSGTLNVIGNGVVTGYGSSGARGATVSINTTSASGKINLYGGTYGMTAESVGFTVCIEDNGGQINMYKAVTVNGNSRYRGVRVGTADRADAILGIYGATLNSRLTIDGADGTAARDIVTIDGATINARVDIYKESTVTLSGKVIVTDGLNLIENALVELGELTEGSNIKVRPTDVFTVLNEKAPNYVGYFFALNGEDSIKLTEDNLALRYVPYVFDGNAIDNSNLVFETGTTNARCDVCNKVVAWTPITAADIGTGMTMTDRHYYLAETINLNNTAITYMLTAPRDTTVCLHLNGHDLINAVVGDSHYAIRNQGKLNILGNGSVHGDARGYHGGAVVMMNEYAGQELNLFGGTYDDQNSRAVSAVAGGGVINVYAGATLNDMIQVQSGDNYTGDKAASVNVYGGTFNTTIGVRGLGTVANSGTPVNIYGGNFNGGTCVIYEYANTVANEAAKCPVNIYGGTFQYTDKIVGNPTEEVNLQVYGGSFSKDPTAYVAEGYEVTETEGVFAVAQKNA